MHVYMNFDVNVSASCWWAQNWKSNACPYLKTNTSSNGFDLLCILLWTSVLVLSFMAMKFYTLSLTRTISLCIWKLCSILLNEQGHNCKNILSFLVRLS